MLLLVFMVWGECAEGECYRAKVSSHGLALYPNCTAFNCEALDALNSLYPNHISDGNNNEIY